MITLPRKQWYSILDQIKQEYQNQPSVFLIRGKMKEVLGFTTRQSGIWDEKFGEYIYLDFFDEAKESYFILKYL